MAEETKEMLRKIIGEGGTLGANSADYGDDEPIARQSEQTGADSAD